jgi:putative endonuclease
VSGERDRRLAYRLGVDAEALAAAHFTAAGYRVLARRYKVAGGEIDLIVRDATTVAFVEVKARRTLDIGLEAISLRAWRRIAAAADLFMADHPEYAAFGWRYDMVVIAPGQPPRHEPDAWRPDA